MIATPEINSELVTQLSRIADALSTPKQSPWLEWIKNIASFVSGLLTAYLGLILQGWFADRKEQTKMRRIVYSELAQSYLTIYSIVDSTTGSNAPRKEMHVMKEMFTFDGEAYMKENRAVFYQLRESRLLTALYSRLHCIRVGENYNLLLLRSDLGFLSDALKESPTLLKYFRQFVGPSGHSLIDRVMQNYKWGFSFEEMVAAGLARVVDPSSEDEPSEKRAK
jgi:hypothetical protein